MLKIYNYKRVGVRKLALIILVITVLFVAIPFLMMPEGNTSPVLPLLAFALNGIFLYSPYKKNSVKIGDDSFEIIGKVVRIENIRSIEIADKQIDVIVDKGVFILGTHLRMVDVCFYNAQDWNDIKKDMENLKTKLS